MFPLLQSSSNIYPSRSLVHWSECRIHQANHRLDFPGIGQRMYWNKQGVAVSKHVENDRYVMIGLRVILQKRLHTTVLKSLPRIAYYAQIIKLSTIKDLKVSSKDGNNARLISYFKLRIFLKTCILQYSKGHNYWTRLASTSTFCNPLITKNYSTFSTKF